MNYYKTMKKIDAPQFQTDPVLAEVRRVKTALAAKHNFDVIAMARSLQAREATDPRFKKQGSTQKDGLPLAGKTILT